MYGIAEPVESLMLSVQMASGSSPPPHKPLLDSGFAINPHGLNLLHGITSYTPTAMLQDQALGFCTNTGTYWGKDAERYVKVQFQCFMMPKLSPIGLVFLEEGFLVASEEKGLWPAASNPQNEHCVSSQRKHSSQGQHKRRKRSVTKYLKHLI